MYRVLYIHDQIPIEKFYIYVPQELKMFFDFKKE